MIKKLLQYIVLIFVVLVNAQQKSAIDAVNNISYPEKIEKASSLDDDFLKNAQEAHKINYVLGEAESYSNLSLVYYFQGKYEKDLRYSLKAISLYELVGDKEKIAAVYAETGYRMKLRNITKAFQYMQKGKRIAEKYRMQKPLLSIYNNYGVLKEMQQEYDSALYYYNKGLQIKEKINDSVGIPYSLNNIAGICVIRKKFDQAKLLYDRAIDIRIRLKDQIGISENYTYYGDLYAMQKQHEAAILWCQKALQKALQFHYTDLIRSNYKMISENYEAINNQKAALYHFKKYTQYKDSLLNRDTNSKIAELEVKFETNKKEKLLAENKNQLLQKEIEVKNARYFIFGFTLFALFIGFIGYLIFRQQKLKNSQQEQEFQLKSAIAQIETQNQLQEQRLSISRDLHDNIGAQLTFIISSVDNIKYAFDIQNEKLDNKLHNISNFAKSTIVELRDTIWAMNSNEISVEDLRARISNFIEKAKTAKEDVDFQFTVDEQLLDLKLNSVFGMNVYRVLQEAINNTVKYANPTQVSIHFSEVDGKVKIKIMDNGVGFDIDNITKGNGLLNMQKRIESIGGIFKLQSELEKGTTISIILSL